MSYRGGSYGSGRAPYPPSSGSSEYRGRHYTQQGQYQHQHPQRPHHQRQYQGYERDARYQYDIGASNSYDSGNQYQEYTDPYRAYYDQPNRHYQDDDSSRSYTEKSTYTQHGSRTPATHSSNQTRPNSTYLSSPHKDSRAAPGKITAADVASTTPQPKEVNLVKGKPILKSYSFGANVQGNFTSSFQATTRARTSDTSRIGHEKSFKTIHEKNPANPKVKTRIEYLTGLSKQLSDPRLSNSSSYNRALSKSYFQFADQVYLPTFKYDKYYLGDKPSNQILIWNLHSTTSSLIIKNNFLIHGPISEVKIVDDPVTGVPMGMCLLSFDGKVEQAHQLALDVVQKCNKTLLIQGRYIRCGLNVNNKLYDEIYKKTISVREEKSKKQKEAEKEREERLELARIKAEKTKTEQLRLERIRAEKLKSEKLQAAVSIYAATAHSNDTRSIQPNEKTKQNSIVHEKHILPTSRCKLSYKLQKYIDNKPFIFISDKYVSSLYVTADQIERFLKKYSIERILQQRFGFYLIFNSIDEAMDCFDNTDGKKFFHYTMYMTLYIPDDEIENTRVGKLGNVKSAQKQITNELHAYLLKDVREKLIGDMVLDVLKSDGIAEFAAEAKKKKDAEREETNRLKLEESNLKELNPVTIVKRLDLNIFKKTKVKKPFVPMSHTLNKSSLDGSEDEESEDEDEEEDESEEENDDASALVSSNDMRKRKGTLSAKSMKKQKVALDNGHVKSVDLAVADGENTDETPADTEPSSVNSPEADIEMKGVGKSILNTTEPAEPNAFAPSTEPPGPVFDDGMEPFKPTLEFLQNIIKTDEDFEIMRELVNDLKVEKPIQDVKFWAWEKMEAMREYKKLSETKDEDGEDVEVFDYEDEILRNKDLRNDTGCFRTEGYRKMPDKHKREYLLHRRKLTNLNPVKHDEDDESNATTHNNIQSSRVNRANTRRFVADISAQKQIIGETDLLDLNQLNKRKKPVQFARSAIHNWGLYALEPIGAGEMIIEYVGERIRQQVAELREKRYLRSGIGSSYLFRVDENTVIDASKKGGIARFINHCCEPSCTAKIIKVGGKKRIVIYALRDIKRNEELTYDYKFERETNDEERIACLCGAPGCKGFLN